jgi:dTDP-4-amino-4,6-dideoxygalactose transaminase
MIPFLDLKKLNQQFQPQLQAEIDAVLQNGMYIKGQKTAEFERSYAAYCGTEHCIGTGNGLDALILILKAYQYMGLLKRGDEVLVPSNTFIATILAVIHAGLKPVLVEPNEKSFNIDLAGIKLKMSKRVKAIIVVHLYGQLVDTKPIESFCKQHNLLLIEDAAQAHGACAADGRRAGNLSDAAAFSFYPSKNLGALGDGGAVTTNDQGLSEAIRLLGNYGSKETYHYEFPGFNSRLDEIQAACLAVKLKHLDKDNEQRRSIAGRYDRGVSNPKIVLPHFSGQLDQVFYVYVVRIEDRTNFIKYLKANGVGYHIHYPLAPHLQNALRSHKFGSYPIAENIHRTVLSIPLNPILTDLEIEHIISVLNAY